MFQSRETIFPTQHTERMRVRVSKTCKIYQMPEQPRKEFGIPWPVLVLSEPELSDRAKSPTGAPGRDGCPETAFSRLEGHGGIPWFGEESGEERTRDPTGVGMDP